MRRDRFTRHTYGRKGGEGPNKGKVRVRYQAQDPDGSWHITSIMVNANAEMPKLAYMRFFKTTEHTGSGTTEFWKASGVRPEPDLSWGGVWKPAERIL